MEGELQVLVVTSAGRYENRCGRSLIEGGGGRLSEVKKTKRKSDDVIALRTAD